MVLCEDLKKSGIQNIIIFGISSEKDETGEISCNQKSIVPMAIKEIKKSFNDEFLVMLMFATVAIQHTVTAEQLLTMKLIMI